LSALRILAIVLIVAGVAALAYGQFTYTKSSHDLNVGPVGVTLKNKRTVNVPLWVGIAAIAAGLVMVIVPRRA